MVRLLVIILCVLGTILAIIYLSIPSRIKFANIIYLNTAKSAAQRYIADDIKWNKWWPGDSTDDKQSKKNRVYTYKDYKYTVDKTMHDGLAISISNTDYKANTFLHFIQWNIDSVVVEWRGEMPVTYNPFKRLMYYKMAHDMKKNMVQILQQAKAFLDKGEKIYGLKILHEMVKDTVLIAAKKNFSNYPTTEQVYEMITEIKSYVESKNGKITNYPMLHVDEGSGDFIAMVALPLREEISESLKFRTKRMVAGKILAAEVRGGSFSTQESIRRIELYMDDYNINSPAIHFESLITNRLIEPDTSKWITKVYYPVY